MHVAARIWCDKEFEHIVMDTDVAMKIAKILFFVANADEASRVLLADTTKSQ